MAEACPQIPHLQLDNTLGAAFIGNLLAAVLYGLTTLQTFIYFNRYHKDAALLKSLVSFLWALDTVHLALISHTVYFYAVTNFSQPLAMTMVTKTIMTHVFITGTSDLTVRLIYLYRVWLLGKRRMLIPATIIVTSLVALGGSIAFPIRGLQVGFYANFGEISWILYTAFAAAVAADVSIAAALCYYLAKHKTGVRRTDSMVKWIMVYTINNGLLTSLCSICVLVTYATMPGNFIFIAFYFVLPKLFLNSLLGTFNARDKLRDFGQSTSGLVSIPLTSVLQTPTVGSYRGVGSRTGDRVEIQINTSSKTRADAEPEEWKRSYPPA